MVFSVFILTPADCDFGSYSNYFTWTTFAKLINEFHNNGNSSNIVREEIILVVTGCVTKCWQGSLGQWRDEHLKGCLTDVVPVAVLGRWLGLILAEDKKMAVWGGGDGCGDS